MTATITKSLFPASVKLPFKEAREFAKAVTLKGKPATMKRAEGDLFEVSYFDTIPTEPETPSEVQFEEVVITFLREPLINRGRASDAPDFTDFDEV